MATSSQRSNAKSTSHPVVIALKICIISTVYETKFVRKHCKKYSDKPKYEAISQQFDSSKSGNIAHLRCVWPLCRQSRSQSPRAFWSVETTRSRSLAQTKRIADSENQISMGTCKCKRRGCIEKSHRLRPAHHVTVVLVRLRCTTINIFIKAVFNNFYFHVRSHNMFSFSVLLFCCVLAFSQCCTRSPTFHLREN